MPFLLETFMDKNKLEHSEDAERELKIFALKYHSIVSWVAIILNPIWVISDYFNSPAHVVPFFIFRIVVSVFILIAVLSRKKMVQFPELMALVPFIGISIQNAYMYSVMNVEEIQKHTFAYIALFIGAGMFVLWKPFYSIFVVVISVIANIIFFSINSNLRLSEIMANGGLLTTSVALFTIILINTRTNLTRRAIIARLELAESARQLAVKTEIIEEKNKNIKDSINYAQRIQMAIFPPMEKIDGILKDYFIWFRPKDIVSGDFYWFSKVHTTPQNGLPPEEVIVIAAVDCTGHGVPGALMSIIGSTILNQSVSEKTVNSPADALNFLNKQLANNLNSISDGMDMTLCAINPTKMELQFAGANNPVYIVRGAELIELKPDKMAIGGDHENYETKTFTNHIAKLEKNDCIYLFTDGYADQFGGEHGKKFKHKNFQKLLLGMQDNIMKDQQYILNYHFEQWKGALEQVDDILIIGIRV